MLLVGGAYLHMLSGDRAQAEAYLAEAEKLGSGLDPALEMAGLSVVFNTLIKGGVRLAWGDFAGALVTADNDLSNMLEREIRCYLPDVLRTRGEALRGLGRASSPAVRPRRGPPPAPRGPRRCGPGPVAPRLACAARPAGSSASPFLASCPGRRRRWRELRRIRPAPA